MFREIRIQLNYGPKINSNEAIKATVAGHLGISILSRHAIRLRCAEKILRSWA
jgi:hypothetical protein